MTVHMAPKEGSGTTECCGLTPFELRFTDAMSTDPRDVTCPNAVPEPSASPRLTGPEMADAICGKATPDSDRWLQSMWDHAKAEHASSVAVVPYPSGMQVWVSTLPVGADPELAALHRIVAAMDDLVPEVADRVVRYLLDRYEEHPTVPAVRGG